MLKTKTKVSATPWVTLVELGKVKELEEFKREHKMTREDMKELKPLLIERSNNIKLNIKSKVTGKCLSITSFCKQSSDVRLSLNLMPATKA